MVHVGGASIPVPPNNGDEYYGHVHPFDVYVADENTYYEVTVRGSVSVTESAQWDQKPCGPYDSPLDGAVFHPLTQSAAAPGALGVHVVYGNASTGMQGVYLKEEPGNPSVARGGVYLVPGMVVRVYRTGLRGAGYCPGGTTYYYQYDFQGEQTVSVTKSVPQDLTLNCPSRVSRGSEMTCTATPTNGSLSDVVWTFTDSAGLASVRGPTGNTARWSGTMVVGGTVRLQANVGRVPFDVSRRVIVSQRGWTWATKAFSSYTEDRGPACFNHTPTFGVPNGINLPANATQCDSTQRQVQPDSYGGAGDGFSTATVNDRGPNHGWHYVHDAVLYLLRTSTINRGLFPDAPRVPLQDTPLYPQRTQCGTAENGYSANWYEFSRCMGADPDAYIAGVKAHEGWGTHRTNGHFGAAYYAMADTNTDPMIYFDLQVEPPSSTIGSFIDRLRSEFYVRAARADAAALDLRDGGTQVTGNWSGVYWGWLPAEGRFSASNHSN